MACLRISLIVAVVVFCAALHVGHGLAQCKACANKEMCKTNATELTMPCTEHCIKLENKKGEVVGKGCGPKDHCEIYRYCYSCDDKDNCNSSSNLMPSFLIFGIVGTIIAKYYM